MTFIEVLLLMIAAHALCDFALQTEAMAKGKNRNIPVKRSVHAPNWIYWLTSHSAIHGGAVGVITGIWWIGVLETVIHWITDFLKCDKRITMIVDQFIHIAAKIIWALLFVMA